jgi:hypothetical protein
MYNDNNDDNEVEDDDKNYDSNDINGVQAIIF